VLYIFLEKIIECIGIVSWKLKELTKSKLELWQKKIIISKRRISNMQ